MRRSTPCDVAAFFGHVHLASSGSASQKSGPRSAEGCGLHLLAVLDFA
jgi:hypothetical protein